VCWRAYRYQAATSGLQSLLGVELREVMPIAGGTLRKSLTMTLLPSPKLHALVCTEGSKCGEKCSLPQPHVLRCVVEPVMGKSADKPATRIVSAEVRFVGLRSVLRGADHSNPAWP